MVKEPNPSPRERAIMDQIAKGIIKKGEKPKPINIRKPPLPPRPPKKS